MKYIVYYKKMVEQEISCYVDAESEIDAIEKAKRGESSEWKTETEQGLETGDFRAICLSDIN